MKIAIMLLFFATILSGCATANKTFTADGKEGYNISCSGSALDWGNCYEKAGRLCGSKGYLVLERIGDEPAMLAGNQYGVCTGFVVNRNLIVSCNDLALNN